mmetsp:Transcript_31609/g.38666  ORF Transcript_31609/g.38666 Transcript_31609/m.38666 type:complete len:233 (+) Transcript_31609:97-795(+)|eukprot:CAMPEP_0172497438 /NCGR_PEP_ID=MMETSP1066-20121228/99904_1 /TAXON_ID=671091 /ORGANISM="Coscinodiscus wailesii, Strain CCMP2513" /LENGTH=232 /DNA_ID=CAMNT_0013270217 /DNA_START=90 /DNA_END=788 /DNA_ORIENTATION=-
MKLFEEVSLVDVTTTTQITDQKCPSDSLQSQREIPPSPQPKGKGTKNWLRNLDMFFGGLAEETCRNQSDVRKDEIRQRRKLARSDPTLRPLPRHNRREIMKKSHSEIYIPRDAVFPSCESVDDTSSVLTNDSAVSSETLPSKLLSSKGRQLGQKAVWTKTYSGDDERDLFLEQYGICDADTSSVATNDSVRSSETLPSKLPSNVVPSTGPKTTKTKMYTGDERALFLEHGFC